MERERTDTASEGKRLAAVESAALVENGQVVGLGTGSTAAFVIMELGRRVREEKLEIVGVPTSFEASRLALREKIPLSSVDQVEGIHIAIDGADQVDAAKNLIKGGGGCHTMEKIVGAFSKRYVIIVDASKLVARLGETFPVPVEVIPAALPVVTAAVERMGGRPELRVSAGKAGPVVTDLGNLLLDVRFPGISDPADRERRLNNIPGVVENGLFTGMVDQVLIGDGSTGNVLWME